MSIKKCGAGTDTRVMRAHWFVALLYSLPAFGQVVGEPGVTYNGKFGENDLCVRNYPWSQICGWHLQQFPEGVSAFQEKSYFSKRCRPLFQQIDGIGKVITSTKASCDSRNLQAANLIAQQATGAGSAAFADVKTLADSVGKSLGDCATTLLAQN